LKKLLLKKKYTLFTSKCSELETGHLEPLLYIFKQKGQGHSIFYFVKKISNFLGSSKHMFFLQFSFCFEILKRIKAYHFPPNLRDILQLKICFTDDETLGLGFPNFRPPSNISIWTIGHASFGKKNNANEMSSFPVLAPLNEKIISFLF
jgi:hypothetical protein